MFNKRNKSTDNYSFSQLPSVDIPRSNFRRSHGHKTMFDSGYLIPIFVDEALPGDSFNLKLSSVARLSTPMKPFMDNLHMDFFFFAVPNRLLWTNWQRFCGERDPDPGSSIDYTVPQITTPAGGHLVGSLADYFGIPTEIDNLPVNSLHFRAYNLIYNEWFRSQDLQDSVTVDTDDGPDTDTNYVIKKRGKRHDYFTSCLPNPQKGTAIDLPLGTSAPVEFVPFAESGNAVVIRKNASGDPLLTALEGLQGDAVSHFVGSAAGGGMIIDPNGRLRADLSTALAPTINSIRQAFQLQKLMEKDARGGTRYTEILNSHFQVVSPDSRLQRPEYLGGGSTPIQITPIAQTLDITGSEYALGGLAAIGYAAQNGVGFTKSFVEHSVIIGMVCVRADLTYQQGLSRMWSRQTKYDYYWPSLANIGEQSVLNQEIWADGSANDALVFGYQERWAEYRHRPSQITNKLRSTYATSLDSWHLAQDFATLPALNSDFIEENPPVDRVVAVPSEPQFVFDGFFDLMCTRPMPSNSVPGMIDHF